MSKEVQGKRVNIVSLKMVRESSVVYKDRKVTSPQQAVKLMEPFLLDSDREKFVVLCLDTRKQPTAISTVAVGTLNDCLVHPREVFKIAILSNAASIIVYHNHPGGDPTPSQSDLNVTNKLVGAGEVMGIQVLDHIIIAKEDHYQSLRESGMM